MNYFFSFWKQNHLQRYFVMIMEIYRDESNDEIMVKYKVSSCGIIGKLKSSEFMSSPLIYAVDPKQIFILGSEEGKCVIKLDSKNQTISSRKIRGRLRRIFH